MNIFMRCMCFAPWQDPQRPTHFPALVLNLLKDFFERSGISFNKFRTSAIRYFEKYLVNIAICIMLLMVINIFAMEKKVHKDKNLLHNNEQNQLDVSKFSLWLALYRLPPEINRCIVEKMLGFCSVQLALNSIKSNCFKTTYISPKITSLTKRHRQSQDRAIAWLYANDYNWYGKTVNYVMYNNDKSKIAIAYSYECATMLNQGLVLRYLDVFDTQTKKTLYHLNCDKKPVECLHFIGDCLKAYHKGSDYIGSDTVREWDLSGNCSFNCAQLALIHTLYQSRNTQVSFQQKSIGQLIYQTLPKEVKANFVKK